MRTPDDACPFDANSRANRCRGCSQDARPLPPCVVAWLADAVEAPLEELRGQRRGWPGRLKAA